jgi:hypothetical protein
MSVLNSAVQETAHSGAATVQELSRSQWNHTWGIVVRKAAAALSAPGCDTFAVRRSLEAWADQRASLRMRAATTCTGGRFVIR